VSAFQQTAAEAATDEWPRPLPVLLAPARGETLSSWLVRHATFFGVSRTNLLRHCAPDVASLRHLDRALTPEQEARLAHLFRLDRSSVRRMTHAELDPGVNSLLVAHDVDHWCEPCARSLAEAGYAKAVLRAWFHTWRITCARCGSRVSPSRRAMTSTDGISALPDCFPHLWAKALEGERLLDAAVHRTTIAVPRIPPVRLLRLLMIWTGGDQVPATGERQRQGWPCRNLRAKSADLKSVWIQHTTLCAVLQSIDNTK